MRFLSLRRDEMTTPERAPLRAVAVLWLAAALGGCGTGLACNNEFGAPPERELWCSPSSDLSRMLFDIQPPPPPPPPETVRCVKTLGERECVPIRAGQR